MAQVTSRRGLVLAEKIRAALPDIPIILGGYFPSLNYPALLQENPFITAVVQGDGEAAALEISHCLAQGRSFLSDQTPNLVWLDEGQVRATPMQTTELESALDLNFQLLSNLTRYQVIAMMTSHGCPFNCDFCAEARMRPYDTYPPAWLARQLAHLEDQTSNDKVFFWDPIFGANRQHALEICRVLGEYRFTYALQSRVDVLSPDLVPILRSVGVELIYLGIESASPATLVRMNKVQSVAQAEKYIQNALESLKTCFENEITPCMSMMLPYPGDSIEDFQAAVDFLTKVAQLHDQIAAQTGVAPGFLCYVRNTIIFAGDLLAEQLEAGRFPGTTVTYEPISGLDIVQTPSTEITPEEVKNYQKQALHCVKLTPVATERITGYLCHIAQKFLKSNPTDTEGVTKIADHA